LWPIAGLAPVHPFLSYKGECRNGDSTSNVSDQCLIEKKCDLPWPAGSTPNCAAQEAVGLHCCKGTEVKIFKDISCENNLSYR